MVLAAEAQPDGTLRLAPARDDVAEVIERLAGSLTGGDPLAELEADHRAEVEAERRWIARNRSR